MEGDKRNERYAQMAAGWVGSPEVHVGILSALADSVGEESPQFTGYVEMQNGLAQQTQSAEIFREIGKPTRAKGSVIEQLEGMIAAEVGKGLTQAQASAKVAKENGSLYARYVTEVQQKI